MEYGLLGGKPKAKATKTRKTARRLQKMGTNGDVILAHINPQEAALLDVLADGEADGGGRNPRTGLRSYGMTDGESGGFGGSSGQDSNAGGVGGGPAGGNTGGGIGGNTDGGMGGQGGGYDGSTVDGRGNFSNMAQAAPAQAPVARRPMSPMINETFLGMPAQPKTYGAFAPATSIPGKVANFFNPVPGIQFGTVFDPVTAEHNPAVAGSKSQAIAEAVGIGLLGPGFGTVTRGIADQMGLLSEDQTTLATYDPDLGMVGSPTTATPSTQAPSTQAQTTDIASSSAATISPGPAPGTGFFGGAPAPSAPDHTNGSDPFTMGMRAVAVMPGTTAAAPKPVSSVEAFLQAHKLKPLSDPYFVGRS